MCGVNKQAIKKIFKPYPNPDGYMKTDLYIDIIQAAALYKGDESVIYLPDTLCKVWNKSTMEKFLKLSEVDSIVYVAEEMDCDDFARILHGEGMPELWTNNHAMNWFITPEGVLYYVEPQTDQISVNIDGMYIRFFKGV